MSPDASPFGTILVPLDGSQLARRVLPYVRAIAAPLRAPIHLLAVVESDRLDLPFYYEQYALQLAEEMQLSLARVVDRERRGLEKLGISVTTQVTIGHPVEAIVRVAQERRADLVALSTHGREGLGRWAMGSVAHDLTGKCPAPLLLLRPGARSRIAPVHYRRILLPLDGSAMSETALPMARQMASGLGAQLVVAQVVPTALNYAMGPLWTVLPAHLEERATDAARMYLEQVTAKLRAENLPVEPVVLQGDPPRTLLNYVADQHIDMVVMATHGHGGIGHMLMGSVADRVVRQSAKPVVLVRPKAEGNTA